MLGETEYAFRHLLVRDVAYGQIPRAERGEKHRLAAEWIEGLGRPEDHAEMVAHHYLAALELSRAAGLDVTSLAAEAHDSLREAGDRAFSLSAFGAAARFYSEALATEEVADAELLFRHAEALFRSGDESAMQALEQAREALVADGSRERAAEADASLAEAWWHRGDRDRCFAHLERAEEIVRDQAPSPAKARVLSQISRYRAIAGDTDRAISAGQEALAIAEQLGLDELRAHALNNISVAKSNSGNLDEAISDLEQSIEIAVAINSPEASRGYNNLAVFHWAAGNGEEALRLRREAIRLGERLGNLHNVRFARSSLMFHLYFSGRWDEAVELAAELLAEAEREPHVGESYAHQTRALIRHARGDTRGALDDARRSLEIARPARDAQILFPALTTWIRLAADNELWPEVEQAAAEVRDELPVHSSVYVPLSINAMWVARRSGLVEVLRSLREGQRAAPVWVDVGMAILDERYADAATALSEIGDVADEAYARLLTGEPHEVERALEFYRSVGATRYIREAEALLAASA